MFKIVYGCVFINYVDGGGAQSPGSTEVCPGLAGASPLPDHAPTRPKRAALLQGPAAA